MVSTLENVLDLSSDICNIVICVTIGFSVLAMLSSFPSLLRLTVIYFMFLHRNNASANNFRANSSLLFSAS